jgi:hypothetical protein
MLATAIPRSKPRSPEVIRLLLALGPTHAQRPKLQWPATPNPSRTGNARASGHDAMLPQPRQRSKGLLQHQCPKNLRDGPATCSRPTGRQNRSLLESSGGRPLFFSEKRFHITLQELVFPTQSADVGSHKSYNSLKFNVLCHQFLESVQIIRKAAPSRAFDRTFF